jgi:ubiquinol-cytochrome c reductase cytochrome b subunit
MLKKVYDWLDDRAGLGSLLKHALDEPVHGGAKWAYVFGSGLAVIFTLQAVTGILLAMSYSPSAQQAWGSVYYIQYVVPFGWLVRGLHHYGASAFVIVAGLHMLQVFIWGAYKKPRELNWISGVLLLLVLLGFALTGYLLPWDQKGYWATQVATNIAGTSPGIGKQLQAVMVGGAEYGTLTLTRFYALHVFVLPAALIGLLVVHLALFRRHGVTWSWKLSRDEAQRLTAPFWPDQLAKDLVFCAGIVAVLTLLSIRTHGAPLDAPANPSESYLARPEWYFLGLFQLLKYFEGPLEVVGTIIIPTIAIGFLFAVPFLDRSETRAPGKRTIYMAIVASGVVAILALIGLAVRDDSRNPQVKKAQEQAEVIAARAKALAAKGIPPEGAGALFARDPETRARKLFGERCAGCHELAEVSTLKEPKAPNLTGFGSRERTRRFLGDPDSPEFFGPTKVRGMKAVVDAPTVNAALTFLMCQAAEGEAGNTGAAGCEPDKVKEAQKVVESKCGDCHELDKTGSLVGPNLGGYASRRWIRELIANPGARHLFGKKNEMPAFGDKLRPEELDLLTDLIFKQRAHGGGSATPGPADKHP